MTEKSFSFDRQRPGPRGGRLAEMLRVDHAGEYGAVQIYKGQRAVFGAVSSKSGVAEKIARMEEGEARHLEAFDRLLAEHRIRPTLLSPLWQAAGFGLGAATAMMGEKAAMACTEAVEAVIEQHYAAQAEELAETEPALAATLAEFREDELSHKEAAETHTGGESDAGGYGVLKALIGLGCRAAIRLSEKI